jgi:hypothetical protein
MNLLHDELMAAYAAAEESLDWCLASGDLLDVEQHRADLRRALKVSEAFHAESDRAVAAWLAAQGGWV